MLEFSKNKKRTSNTLRVRPRLDKQLNEALIL